MKHDDFLIEYYRSLNPRRFSYVEKLELFPESSEDSGMSLTLVVELLSDMLENQNLRLSFYGVKDLQIHIARDYVQLPDLQVIPIHGSQLEGLRYQVTSIDANKLSFFCQNFAAKIVANKDEEEFS